MVCLHRHERYFLQKNHNPLSIINTKVHYKVWKFWVATNCLYCQKRTFRDTIGLMDTGFLRFATNWIVWEWLDTGHLFNYHHQKCCVTLGSTNLYSIYIYHPPTLFSKKQIQKNRFLKIFNPLHVIDVIIRQKLVKILCVPAMAGEEDEDLQSPINIENWVLASVRDLDGRMNRTHLEFNAIKP